MNTQKKRFIIIDGNAIIHRAYHALPPLTGKDGMVVNAVYGFTSMLLKILADLKPEFLAVTFDVAGGTFRDAISDKYKATRVKADQALYDQIPLVYEMVRAFNVPIYTKEGFEADDVIGTLVKHQLKNKKELVDTIVVTGDRDLLQLVDESTTVYLLKKGVTEFDSYDPAKVKEYYGFGPEFVVDYKALRGDSSDNIPGVKGIGEKGAKELIEKIGGIDEIYTEIKNQKSKIRDQFRESVIKKLEDDEAGARMSKQLASIECNVPDLEFELEKAQVRDFDREKVLELFQKFSFVSLLKRLPGGAPNPPEADQPRAGKKTKSKKKVVTVNVVSENFAEFLEEIKNADEFCCKEVINGKPVMEGELVGFIFCLTNKIFLLELSNVKEKECEKVFDLFLDKKKLVIGHDVKPLVKVFFKTGREFNAKLFDIMIASYVLNASTRAHDMKSVVLRELGEELADTPKETLFGIDMHALAVECGYFCDLKNKYFDDLKEQKDFKLFEDIEMALIPVLAAMEVAGVYLDVPMLKKMNLEVTAAIEKVSKKIWKEAGEEFNIASNNQLRDVLFEKMGLVSEGIKKGKTGYSTASSELEKLRGTSPIIEMIEEFREFSKLQNTYIDVLPDLVNPQTGRIHSSFNQAVAATGRLSGADPNLQNIPIRTELGREVRRAFLAEKGNTLVAADYSQIELRIVAALAGDKTMVDAFKAGEDIHRATAAVINDVPLDKVTKEMRSAAKTINFGVLYGQGAYGLAGQTGMTQWEAKEFIAKYFEKFDGLKKYMDGILEQAKKTGYVETLFGRKRYVPELKSANFQLRNAGERMAINMPVQGTAADIMKMGMIESHARLQELKEWQKGEIKIILQVHDELVVEVKEGLEEKVSGILKKAMEGVVELSVPIVVDVSVGKRWGDLK